MKAKLRFNESDGDLESCFDSVSISTVPLTDCEAWADAMLDILKLSQFSDSAIIFEMACQRSVDDDCINYFEGCSKYFDDSALQRLSDSIEAELKKRKEPK